MTDTIQERARALYEATATNTSGGSDWKAIAISRITAALQAERARVWEEAAQCVERKELNDEHIWFMGNVRGRRVNEVLMRRAEECRQRAKEDIK